MYEHSFFDGPGMTMYFLVYYADVFRVHWMSCGCAVMEYWGRGLEMFLTLSPIALPDSPLYASGQLICGHL